MLHEEQNPIIKIDDKNWSKQASEHLFFCQSMYVFIYLPVYYIIAVTVTMTVTVTVPVTVTVTVTVTVPAVPIAYLTALCRL
jgi:hypothetical protein